MMAKGDELSSAFSPCPSHPGTEVPAQAPEPGPLSLPGAEAFPQLTA